MQRYFINQELSEVIELSDATIVHHIKNVMRNNCGEYIGLIYNREDAIYEITDIEQEVIICKFYKKPTHNPELKIQIDLATPFLKKDNFELAISKMTECGIHSIIPTIYKRNVVVLDNKKFNKKLSRYQEIVKSAAMQSQRNYIPNITNMTKLSEINFNQYDLIITCYENEERKTIVSLDEQIKNSTKILVIIGPEGGLDNEEIELLNNIENNNIVSLGNRILRSETAQIATMFYLSMIIEGAL